MTNSMTTSAVNPSGAGASTAAMPRLVSLDAFRGFVILTMVFVNFLSGVDQIPAWAKHMPGTMDGYTFVDLVFPGFLFIVGVAIPMAIQNRRKRGDTLDKLLVHIGVRALSLLFLGVILVNAESFSPEATGMSQGLWYFLALSAVVVLWGARSASWPAATKLWLFGLRVLALLLLGYLLVIYRGTAGNGQTVWLRHSWWGILGLIGWAYLNGSLVYLATRGNSTAMVGIFGFMLALYVGGRHGRLDWLGPLNNLVGVGAVLGSTSANVMAGVLVGNLFTGNRAGLPAGNRLQFMVLFGLGLYLAGMLLRPLHGIIKNQATESYTLVAAGICCLLFMAFYWVIDVRGCRWWVGCLLPAGQNPLLAYLLPDIVSELFAALGLAHLLWPYHSGLPGALNAAVLTIVVLLLNGMLTRARWLLKM